MKINLSLKARASLNAIGKIFAVILGISIIVFGLFLAIVKFDVWAIVGLFGGFILFMLIVCIIDHYKELRDKYIRKNYKKDLENRKK